MRIGILGGTFDPPHKGHIALARAAIEQLELDEVLFIPAARNPLKERRSSHPKDRMEMVRRAIAGEEKLSYSDIEMARGGKSYTIETLSELSYARPGEYWIILGSDALRDFDKWKSPEKIVMKARIAVAVRPGQSKSFLQGLTPDWLAAHLDWLDGEFPEISSTEIRLRAQEGRRPYAQWLSPSVMDYIEQKKLYR